MRCSDCPYWYAEAEAYERCQFEGPDGWAPCEQDDVKTPDDYYEREVRDDETD